MTGERLRRRRGRGSSLGIRPKKTSYLAFCTFQIWQIKISVCLSFSLSVCVVLPAFLMLSADRQEIGGHRKAKSCGNNVGSG